jgi:AcrR family transcriptional regulator
VRRTVTRVKPQDERRADLLRAAAVAFVAKGVDDVTVADITSAAGVAKGTFYLYFESKSHVLRELRVQVSDQLRTKIAGLATSNGTSDWWSVTDETVRVIIEYWLADRDLHRVVLAGSGDAFATLDDYERSMEAMLAQFILVGVGAGVVSCSDPPLMARLIIHAVEGVVYHAITEKDPPDAERLIAVTTELVHRALRP